MNPDPYNAAVDDLHQFLELHSSETIDLDTNLLEKGIVDSLLMMDLIVHIERTYGVRLEAEDIVPSQFQSIAALARLVATKLDAQQPASHVASRMRSEPTCSESAARGIGAS